MLQVSFFSVRLVAGVSDHSLKRVLGAFLILVSIYFFFLSERIRLRPTLPMQLGMGGLAGLPAVFIGLYLGGKVFDRIPVKVLRKDIYAYMAVAGLLALLL